MHLKFYLPLVKWSTPFEAYIFVASCSSLCPHIDYQQALQKERSALLGDQPSYQVLFLCLKFHSWHCLPFFASLKGIGSYTLAHMWFNPSGWLSFLCFFLNQSHLFWVFTVPYLDHHVIDLAIIRFSKCLHFHYYLQSWPFRVFLVLESVLSLRIHTAWILQR